MEVCAECARDRAVWAAGSLLLWHHFQPREPIHLLRKAEGVVADRADLPEYTQIWLFLGKPQTLWPQWRHSEDRGGEGAGAKEPGGLAVNTCVDGKSGMPESRLHFFPQEIELFPFFLLNWAKIGNQSPVLRESRKGYCFPFHTRHLFAQGWPWENTQMFVPSKAE